MIELSNPDSHRTYAICFLDREMIKHVENNDSADPSQKFNFKVKLLGENVNLSSIDKYKVNQTVSSNGRSAEKTATENSKSSNNDFIGVNVSDGGVSSNLISRNNGAFPIDVQDNVNLRSSTDIDSGTFDDVDWRITSDGELIIGNGTTQYWCLAQIKMTVLVCI